MEVHRTAGWRLTSLRSLTLRGTVVHTWRCAGRDWRATILTALATGPCADGAINPRRGVSGSAASVDSGAAMFRERLGTILAGSAPPPRAAAHPDYHGRHHHWPRVITASRAVRRITALAPMSTRSPPGTQL